MSGIVGTEFSQEDDAVICNPGNHPIARIWMGESHVPGDEHIGEGNRWCIQFTRGGGDHVATIYFDGAAARRFRDEVNRSMAL